MTALLILIAFSAGLMLGALLTVWLLLVLQAASRAERLDVRLDAHQLDRLQP